MFIWGDTANFNCKLSSCEDREVLLQRVNNLHQETRSFWLTNNSNYQLVFVEFRSITRRSHFVSPQPLLELLISIIYFAEAMNYAEIQMNCFIIVLKEHWKAMCNT
jgi:hypothetical protein